MEQMSIDTTGCLQRKIIQGVDRIVSDASRMYEIGSTKTVQEAYGIQMQAFMKLKEKIKELDKKMGSLLESLDGGINTTNVLADIVAAATAVSMRAVQLGAKAKRSMEDLAMLDTEHTMTPIEKMIEGGEDG